MRIIARLASLWRNLFRRARVERDLDDEIASYVDLLVARKQRSGMKLEAARREALLEVGGVEQVKERVRDVWLGALLSSIVRDVRHGMRSFARAPGFTAAVVISLALGIGGTTAIFSVLNAVLLRPLPYPDADALHEVRVWWGDFSASLSPADLAALREQRDAVSVGAWLRPEDGLAYLGDAGPEILRGAIVTRDLPEVLGVRPLIGSWFSGDDAAREVLIAESLWRDRFGGALDVQGRTMKLDGDAFTIVGVMPAGYNVPRQADGVVWMKFEPQPATRRGAFYLNGVVRTDREASTIAQQLTARSIPILRDRYGVTNEWRYEARPLKDVVIGDIRPTLRLLGWTVPLVLLIGVLNFSNLLLARGLTRRHEIGVRAALGAGRGRIAAQLLIEAGLLGLFGGVAGLLVALVGLRLAAVPAAAVVPRMHEVQLDGSVVMFAIATGIVAGLLAGILPALRLPWSSLMTDIRDRARGGGPGYGYARARRVLVSAVVALTLTVLVSAALLVKSLLRLESVHPGFDAAGVLSFRLSLPEQSYGDSADGKTAALLAQLEQRVRALPGVSLTALASSLPPDQLQIRRDYTIEGTEPDAAARGADVAEWILASSDYFAAMRIAIVRGRAFAARDRVGAPQAAIVNEAFVRRHFGGADPVGKRLKGGDRDSDAPWLTIVGVAADVPYSAGVWEGTAPTVYAAYDQNPWQRAPFVLARTTGDPAALIAPVRSIVQELDRELPLRDVATMRERLHDSAAAPRLRSQLFLLLAVIALALAVTGIFGLLAYDVNQHRQDIAVRRALGAPTRAVVATIARSGLTFVAAGTLLGVAGALLAGRLLAGLLYGVTPRDTQVIFIACAVIALAAVAASVLPALAAARIDPMRVLRQQ